MKPNEKTLTICGKEVHLLYCAAAETGFEQLAGKSIGDINFKLQEDLLRLAVAAIIAAYSKKGEDAPISTEELLYEAKPKEVIALVEAVLNARFAWYGIPVPLKEEIEKENKGKEDAPKNVETPTTDTESSWAKSESADENTSTN